MMIEGSGSGAGPGSIHLTSVRIQEAQKHVDPVDPDPEHWLRARSVCSVPETMRAGSRT